MMVAEYKLDFSVGSHAQLVKGKKGRGKKNLAHTHIPHIHATT